MAEKKYLDENGLAKVVEEADNKYAVMGGDIDEEDIDAIFDGTVEDSGDNVDGDEDTEP